MNHFVIKICDRWVRKKIIDVDYYDIYEYGIRAIILSLIGIINVIILGVITQTYLNAALFLTIFISLRKYTGGYHADTSFKCNLFLVITYLIHIIIIYFVSTQPICLHNLVTIFCFILFIYLGPVENKNKDLIESRRKRNQKIIILAIVGLYFVYYLIRRFDAQLAFGIDITLVEIVIYMVIGYIKNICCNVNGT